jgi:hypothetical protein
LPTGVVGRHSVERLVGIPDFRNRSMTSAQQVDAIVLGDNAQWPQSDNRLGKPLSLRFPVEIDMSGTAIPPLNAVAEDLHMELRKLR